jgi:hypothetical protein
MNSSHALRTVWLLASIAAISSSVEAQVLPTSPVGCSTTFDGYNESPKVNTTSRYGWSCANDLRTLSAIGIPDHPVSGGRFATAMRPQTILAQLPLLPQLAERITTLGGPSGAIGYAVNGVKFDPSTNGSCASSATGTRRGDGCVAARGRDPWHLEALGGAFQFGTDESNAHVQPDGAYHYHGVPSALVARLNAKATMTLVGWAVDGYPIYARYGYSIASDARSAVKVVTSSYQKKATPDTGRPSVAVFPMGTFTEDYEYVAGAGDLDECNGRVGPTPEFPAGIYHYYITDTFPFVQRCVKGTAATREPRRRGR